MPELLVAIPSFNEGINIKRTVDYVRRELPHSDILVIDDSDQKESLQIVKEISETVIHRETRSGESTAYNLAAQYSLENSYSSLLLLEADLVLRDLVLKEFVNKFQDFDVLNCACYPVEPRKIFSYAYCNFAKMRAWIHFKQKTGLMTGRAIMLRASMINDIFPIPKSFLDPNAWITGKALATRKKVSVSWNTRLYFVVPQSLGETIKENARAKFSAKQIQEHFPEMASKQSGLILSMISISLMQPKFFLSWPWLFGSMLRRGNYDNDNTWQINESTKDIPSSNLLAS